MERSTQATKTGQAAARRPGSGDRADRPADRATAPLELAPTILTAALSDYSLLPSDADAGEFVETLETLHNTLHYRVRLAKSYATGHSEFCAVSDGFLVHVSDVSYDSPYMQRVSAPDLLRVRIASDGDVQYVPEHGEKLDLIGRSAAIIIEPPGMPPAQAIFGAQHNHQVHVYISREALKKMYEGDEESLPAVVREFLAGTLEQTVAHRLSLEPGMLRCLEDLRLCPLEARSRRLMIQSKATEILCYAFGALLQEEQRANPLALSSTTTRSVFDAQRLLSENFASPPSLNELARMVGISRSGLCSAFRQVFGQTVFDHITDLRMQHALEMLKNTDVPITQIAHSVGFSQLSNFTMAMQRRLGTSPSELRRGGAGPAASGSGAKSA